MFNLCGHDHVCQQEGFCKTRKFNWTMAEFILETENRLRQETRPQAQNTRLIWIQLWTCLPSQIYPSIYRQNRRKNKTGKKSCSNLDRLWLYKLENHALKEQGSVGTLRWFTVLKLVSIGIFSVWIPSVTSFPSSNMNSANVRWPTVICSSDCPKK